MKKITPGSLICYNAGGMKYKTLGLVLEIDRSDYHYGRETILLLIQWGVGGKIMPRQVYKNSRGWGESIKSGDLCWHELGDWFEEVK